MLKKIILLSLFYLFIIDLSAQRNTAEDIQRNIEQNMLRDRKKAFQKKFPNIKQVKWEKEGNNWEAEFKLDEVKVSAIFSKSSKWLATKQELNTDKLPQIVRKQLTTIYPSCTIKTAELVEQANGITLYQVEIKNHNTIIEMLLKSDGTLMKETVERNDDDDDDDNEQK